MPKLLVIDDEPAILDMMKNHFTIRGYDVVTAEDGSEGLSLLETEQPDLVLLDLKMKKMDGDQFLKEVRERKSQAKVIVITGYQDPSFKDRMQKFGVDAFFEKPASITELQRKVYEIVGG